VPLRPFGTWPKGLTKDQLTEQMTQALTREFPGVEFNFSQYIEDNVEEAASGVKGENSVKIYGNDLETLERSANQIAKVLADVPGITDLAVLRSLGQPRFVSMSIANARPVTAWHPATSTPCTDRHRWTDPGDLYEQGSDRHFRSWFDWQRPTPEPGCDQAYPIAAPTLPAAARSL